MIYIKEHRSDKGIILALCDSDLIGRVLKDNDASLDLKAYASFYKGELKDVSYVKDFINSNRYKIITINAVGREAVDLLIALSMIEDTNVRYVENVPYAFTVNLSLI
ncbi:MAG: hypothetical protein ARM1_0076 [Candidatus Micrarchaeota archaeon]|nr:MAG: hypothetical protein ARM1_0076 [Candidatus Micrarchaeota archaeon]